MQPLPKFRLLLKVIMRRLKHEIWPYTITLSEKKSKEAEKWCKDNIGMRFRAWYSYTTDRDTRTYAFKDTDTLLVFKLKWGNLK